MNKSLPKKETPTPKKRSDRKLSPYELIEKTYGTEFKGTKEQDIQKFLSKKNYSALRKLLIKQ